jgi:LmbE family N-acetylglucosaminyl deacetylase
MRWIYLSPHLDDAALSAGGLIHMQTRAGTSVEIWTVLCGLPPWDELSPFAREQHQKWGAASADEIVRIRRAEDVTAAGILGARPRHFDFLDCIYRRAPDGEWLYDDIYAPPHPDEPNLPRRIAAAVSVDLRADDVLVCPLAIGPHVDHLIVRRAAEWLGRPLVYAADFPYLISFPGQLTSITAGMTGKPYPITETSLRTWQTAVAAYASQISTVFESREKMRAALREYWAGPGGICLWKA